MWITLPGYPSKGMEGRLSIDYEYENKHPNELRFDLEVHAHLGWFSILEPDLYRKALTLEEAVDIMFDADNGSADHLLRALAGDTLVDSAWERFHVRAAR